MYNYIYIIKQICNILSSVLFTLIYYPQIKRLVKTNNTKSFSINYLRILLLAYFFYTIFLILEELYILLISSILNSMCIIYMYYKKVKNINESKRKKQNIDKQIEIQIN